MTYFQCLRINPVDRAGSKLVREHVVFDGVPWADLISSAGANLPLVVISALSFSKVEYILYYSLYSFQNRELFNRYCELNYTTRSSGGPVDTQLAPDLGDQLVGRSLIGEATINSSMTGSLFSYVPGLSSTSSPPPESPLRRNHR